VRYGAAFLFLFDSGSRALRFPVGVLIMLGSTLYAGWFLQPRIHQLAGSNPASKLQREEAERRFQKLHARSCR
jgi:hypothetical protein